MSHYVHSGRITAIWSCLPPCQLRIATPAERSYGNGYHIHFRRDFPRCRRVVLGCAVRAPAHYHRLHRPGRGTGPVRTESGLRYGVGVRCGTRGHYFPAVPARPRYETLGTMEQLAAVHSGRASLRCCVRHSRLWSSAPIRIRGARCRAHRRRTHIFIDHHRHQTAPHHGATPQAPGRTHDCAAPVSRSAGDHCLGGDGKPWRASELTDLAKHFPAATRLAPTRRRQLGQRALRSVQSHQALRSLSRIYLFAVDWMVSGPGGTGGLDGFISRNWRLYRRHQYRQQPYCSIYRHQP